MGRKKKKKTHAIRIESFENTHVSLRSDGCCWGEEVLSLPDDSHEFHRVRSQRTEVQIFIFFFFRRDRGWVTSSRPPHTAREDEFHFPPLDVGNLSEGDGETPRDQDIDNPEEEQQDQLPDIHHPPTVPSDNGIHPSLPGVRDLEEMLVSLEEEGREMDQTSGVRWESGLETEHGLLSCMEGMDGWMNE